MEETRTIKPGELEGWVAQLGVGFHFEVAGGLHEYVGGTIELDRTWASFDGPTVVGTLRSFATDLTVPGPRTVSAAALTNVTVAPTHRRQGRLTAMIEADLRASAERGEAVGILVASEYPIYGRFGYGPAIESARYTVDTRGLRFREPPRGTVELVDRAALRREAPAVYDRYRLDQPGAIERPAHWWDRSLRMVEVPGDEPAKGRQALYRNDDGAVEGYARYEGKPDWDGMRPQGTLELRELVSTTPASYHGLWSYLAGVDLLTSINAGERPTDEVLPFLVTDARHVTLAGRHDFVWVRVLDAARALGGRTYATEGRLVLEVLDPLGLAGGRVVLDGDPQGASCEPTTTDPDLTVPIDALGSLYLGGVAARTLALAGRLTEHRAGAVAVADALFRTSRAPWCSTWF